MMIIHYSDHCLFDCAQITCTITSCDQAAHKSKQYGNKNKHVAQWDGNLIEFQTSGS